MREKIESRLRETGALLDAPGTPPFDYLSEVLVSELAGLEGPLLMVLEDYHVVDSVEVHRLMDVRLTACRSREASRSRARSAREP